MALRGREGPDAGELRESAAQVRQATRDAMHELREALGVLGPLSRDTGTDALTDATGTRADVEALVAESRARPDRAARAGRPARRRPGGRAAPCGVKRMVRLESVVISVFGAVLGIGTGVFLAWAGGKLTASSFETYETVLPWGRLGLFLLISVVVGVLAALWPARRAAQLNMLESINAQ